MLQISKFLSGLLLTAVAPVAIAAPGSAAYGDWVPETRIDRMTDKKTCSLRNRKHPRVLFTDETLSVLFQGYGGVEAYRYRIDANPASELRVSNDRMSYEWLNIINYRNELANGKKLLISAITLRHLPVDMEISLAGLKAARAQMLKDCSIADPHADQESAPSAEPALAK